MNTSYIQISLTGIKKKFRSPNKHGHVTQCQQHPKGSQKSRRNNSVSQVTRYISSPQKRGSAHKT